MSKSVCASRFAFLYACCLVATPTGGATATSPATATAPARELALDLGDGGQLKLAPIPPGRFFMGSSDEQRTAIIKALTDAGLARAQAAEFVKDESPRHEVTISQPFHMGITPVTVDQFAAFVKETGYNTGAERSGGSLNIDIGREKLRARSVRGASWREPGFEQKGDHPVVHVDWKDAQAFCAWLSKKSGHTVRLPTEAQWEYACRAGSDTIYAWGDNPDDGKGWANCADHTLQTKMDATPAFAFFAWDDGFVYTSPVASFKANAFGLHDMIGNVWQWCEDRWSPYGKDALTDPAGPEAGRVRVLRGGSWNRLPARCRPAHRGPGDPSHRDNNYGFRVVVIERIEK